MRAMHQRIGLVGPHHLRIVRQQCRRQAVRHAKRRRQLLHHLQHLLLECGQPQRQRRRRQDQAAQRRQPLQREARREQPAHAMSKQERWLGIAARKIFDDDFGVLQHRVAIDDVAALALRAAVSAMIVAAHRQAAFVEESGKVPVTSAVLAKPMHEHDAAARLCGRQHVVRDIQHRAVGGTDLVALQRHQLWHYTPQRTS